MSFASTFITKPTIKRPREVARSAWLLALPSLGLPSDIVYSTLHLFQCLTVTNSCFKVFLHYHMELLFVFDINFVNFQAIFVLRKLCAFELSYLSGQ